METELNITNILKDKPSGTKLYADAFGELSLECVNLNRDNSIYVKTKTFNCCSFYNDGKYTKEGEPILVPSKKMRDWNKFAWKRGDVLVSDDGKNHVIFSRWYDDNYTSFCGKHYLNNENKNTLYYGVLVCTTEKYSLEDKNIAKAYINAIEERLDGKLNLETLEIEKQQEFKDGDIITITTQMGNILTFIFRAEDVKKYYCHALLYGKIVIANDDSFYKKDFYTARQSTEEEQKQLFDALAKENKAWDSVKKQIVDLKTKWNPKPFDRVVTRVDDNAIWTANIFSHIDQYGEYNTIGCVGGYPYCLPYNEETAKLIGTTNNWEG